MNIQYEKIPCPFCGSWESKKHRNSSDIVKCENCDIVYLRTRFTKENMYEWYQKFADDSHMSIPATEELAKQSGLKRRDWFQEIMNHIESTGTILDIGCGWGAFLDNARDCGFNVRGIELTRKCVDFANNILKIPVVDTQFDDIEIDNNSIDIITMNHVLEHLPNPSVSLKKISNVLISGGLFCGIVPNIESFGSENFMDDWYWLDANNHYVHYSTKTLTNQLERNGLKMELLYTTTGDFDRNMLLNKIHHTYETDDNNKILNKLESELKGEEIRFISRKI